MVTLIWAMNDDGVIGYKNKIPWFIKEDLIHFKNYTLGKTILMGRKTYESLNFKPLPDRTNIVITRQEKFNPKDNSVQVSTDLQGLLKKWKKSKEELVVIGGGEVYKEALKYADRLVISIVKYKTEGDVYFPKFSFDDYKIVDRKSFAEFNVLYYEKKED